MRGLHAFFRQSDSFSVRITLKRVNFSDGQNHADSVSMESTGLVLKLHREHFGTTRFSPIVPTEDVRLPAGRFRPH